MKFELGGQLGVTRSLHNTLPIDLWDEFSIIVKMVEEPA
jgi:hypothetical protein